MSECIDGCFNQAFEEVIYHASDDEQSAKEFFTAQENKLSWSTALVRILGILLSVGGLYLLFTPVILTLKWVPLIGILL